MAHNRATRQRAMELYAAGELSMEQIAQKIEVDHTTVYKWKNRKIPEDWDLFAQKVVEKTTEMAVRRLSAQRAELGIRHFEDYEFARTHWKRIFYEEAIDPDTKEKVLRPRVVTAKELRDLMGSYDIIQRGERLVFGQEGYILATPGKGGQLEGAPVPPEYLKRIEDALGIGNADPGEPSTDEEDES